MILKIIVKELINNYPKNTFRKNSSYKNTIKQVQVFFFILKILKIIF